MCRFGPVRDGPSRQPSGSSGRGGTIPACSAADWTAVRRRWARSTEVATARSRLPKEARLDVLAEWPADLRSFSLPRDPSAWCVHPGANHHFLPLPELIGYEAVSMRPEVGVHRKKEHRDQRVKMNRFLFRQRFVRRQSAFHKNGSLATGGPKRDVVGDALVQRLRRGRPGSHGCSVEAVL